MFKCFPKFYFFLTYDKVLNIPTSINIFINFVYNIKQLIYNLEKNNLV